MKGKGKVLILALCALLLVVGSVMGTLAYLTAQEEVTNTFTMGKVALKLDEADVDEYGVKVAGADRVTSNEYKLLPGHSYTKDPTVTVVKGSEAAYVRMLVTINCQEEIDAIDALDNQLAAIFTGYDGTLWPLNDETVGNDGNTRTYEFRYNTIVPATAADIPLAPLFTAMVIPGAITQAELNTLAGLKITIVAQAIQADGFTTADAAWDAFDASVAP